MRKKRTIALLLMLVCMIVPACMGALAATEHTVTIDYDGHGDKDAQGNNYPTTQTVPDGATVGQPQYTQVAGWEFQGWYLVDTNNAMLTTSYDFNTPVKSNITIRAKWEQLKYTVTFDKNCTDNAVTVPAPITDVAHGSTVTKPNDPTRDGYTFQGWYLETSGINEFNFGTSTVTENITLYAKWQRTQWTVTFKPENGVQDFTQTVNDGEKASKPADPVKQGYRFDGWYNGNTKYEFTENVESNINLTAKWTQVYKVVFNLNGHGDTIKPVSVAADKKISEVSGIGANGPKPTAEGFDFRGWYTDQACTDGNEFSFNQTSGNAATTLGISDSTINLYAKWTARVTVKFEVGTSVTHEYDGTHPNSIQFQLYKNGVATGNTVTFNKNNGNWVVGSTDETEYIWYIKDWPADDVYTVREVSVPENFTEVCTRNGVNSYTITNVPNEKYAVTVKNTHEVDKIDIMVSKIWEDNNNKHRPEQIQVKVSWTEGSTNHEQILTLTSPDWTATLKGQYRRAAGQIIQYKIEEVNNPLGYKATCEVVVDESGNYSVRIINVLTGRLDIQGKKQWEDDNDRDGIRPESVQLKIYENAIDANNLVAVVIVDATDKDDDNTWNWTVQDLPIYDKLDRPITYIVVEDPVPDGYTATGPQYITVNVNNTSTNP